MSSKKTLYVSRSLLNTEPFLKHFRAQGFTRLLDADDLHVTIAFSRAAVDWNLIKPHKTNLNVVNETTSRKVSPLGDEAAIVLHFASDLLHARWEYFRQAGAKWEYEGYQPHVTLTYQGDGVDLSTVIPYRGPLLFGPERFVPVVEDWEVGRG